MKRCVTGVKPTNKLHLGNYCGIIPTIQELKNKGHEIFLFSADLHSLTSPTKDLLSESLEVIKFFLACLGEDFTYYIQSEFYQSPYLSWILSCNTTFGALNRMTQFKSVNDKESINAGYLYYPVLMAADILLVEAEIVPVGYDQTQHIELTRDLAETFNKRYGKCFVVPEAFYSESPKVFDLQNPERKMSKTIAEELRHVDLSIAHKGTIFFEDEDDVLIEKIKKAKTDSLPMPENISEICATRKEIHNLCLIYSVITQKSFEEIEKEFAGKYISIFKNSLQEAIVQFVRPIREQMKKISYSDVRSILDVHKHLVNEVQERTLLNVKKLSSMLV